MLPARTSAPASPDTALRCRPYTISSLAALRPAGQSTGEALTSPAAFCQRWPALLAQADMEGCCSAPGVKGEAVSTSHCQLAGVRHGKHIRRS